ncbi:glycosyl hydrolase family 61-domain-containing protein [Mycena filopes]|nr:glycosyl hydrolase family 61-domain-containing protein [Mycena filopes]
MKPTALLAASLLLMATSAAAHGWVSALTANAETPHRGPKPLEQEAHAPPSAIRQITNNLPVKDLTSTDLACGRGAAARPAPQVVVLPAGADLRMQWTTLTKTGNWFHNMGPMMFYMASCGEGSCAEFDATKARWFKIAEQGLDGEGKWAQAKLGALRFLLGSQSYLHSQTRLHCIHHCIHLAPSFSLNSAANMSCTDHPSDTDDGSPSKVTLPANLAPGNYLLRTEIIALHTAQSVGGAEFYPSCAQLHVTGSGKGAPRDDELVRFPGAYEARESGILIDVRFHFFDDATMMILTT